jgi:hypothetical protein
MSDWPLLDELKQVLDVDPESDAWDGDYDETRLTRLLTAAIDAVKDDIGAWDETYDFPTTRQAQAALRMAELMALKPEVAAAVSGVGRVPAAVATDPVYRKLMSGSRRKFGIA